MDGQVRECAQRWILSPLCEGKGKQNQRVPQEKNKQEEIGAQWGCLTGGHTFGRLVYPSPAAARAGRPRAEALLPPGGRGRAVPRGGPGPEAAARGRHVGSGAGQSGGGGGGSEAAEEGAERGGGGAVRAGAGGGQRAGPGGVQVSGGAGSAGHGGARRSIPAPGAVLPPVPRADGRPAGCCWTCCA